MSDSLPFFVKLILKKYPDYDLNRYRFKFGDIVTTNDGALIFVTESAIEYVKAYVLKSSFTYKRFQYTTVPYTDLPYYHKGEFESEQLPVLKSLRWRVGAVVHDVQFDNYMLLTEERDGGFVGLVINPDSKYYYKTSVWVMNPWQCYISV